MEDFSPSRYPVNPTIPPCISGESSSFPYQGVPVEIALTGDVMLGRLVNQLVIEDSRQLPTSVWGDVLPILLSSDLRLANLECVISTKGTKWKPEIKPFHFRAHPRAVEFLQAGKFDVVTLANNHVLDYGPEALSDCLTLLKQAGIQCPGAGGKLNEALKPAFLKSPLGTIGVMALTDHPTSWEAMPAGPGVNYISYTREGLQSVYRARLEEVFNHVRRECRFLIVSAHIGPNWGAPSPAIQTFAHELLDMGIDLFWGHSNHTPQGIEIYNGKVIFYSTGDFVDDYAVDPKERNDLSFLFTIALRQNHVTHVHLYPTRIENCRVRLAEGEDRVFLEKSMQAKCSRFQTTLRFQRGVGTVTVPSP